MSPVRIEARGEISFKLPGETVNLKKGEVISLPEAPSQVVVEVEEPSFSITKRTHPNPNVSRKADAIQIQGRVEGWISTKKGKRQSLQELYCLQELYYCSAGDLEESPVTVLNEKGKKIVKIFWTEE